MTNKAEAVAISRSHALNNPLQLQEGVDFSCFPIKENVVLYSVVMLFRKFHHLLTIVDEKIRVILESGLLSKWEMDSVKTKTFQTTMSSAGEPQVKLALEHVEGAFVTIIIGLIFCLVLFGVECGVYYVEKNEKFVEFKKKFKNSFKNIRVNLKVNWMQFSLKNFVFCKNEKKIKLKKHKIVKK